MRRHAVRRYLASLFLVAVFAAPAAGDPLDNAVAAYGRGEYKEAVRLLKPMAGKGDGKAQTMLGVMYMKGEGVPQDYAEALKWLRKAADQGYPDAQFHLASLYYNGRGVPLDRPESVKWIRRAAGQGHAEAQYTLGRIYDSGRYVPQDNVLAYMWLDIAASNGSAPAGLREIAARERDLVAGSMEPGRLAIAKKKAGAWKPKMERQGKE